MANKDSTGRRSAGRTRIIARNAPEDGIERVLRSERYRPAPELIMPEASGRPRRSVIIAGGEQFSLAPQSVEKVDGFQLALQDMEQVLVQDALDLVQHSRAQL